MSTVTEKEAKAQLPKLLAQIEKSGQPIVICRDGKPVADLVPHRKVKRNMKPHPVLSKIKILYDPTEPLSEEEWPKEYR
jgi:antitoxin (DNA-binding transcriptional repressor) of toxin-antitoxin stability system